MRTEKLQLERLGDAPDIRRAAAKTLKSHCLTYLPHHFAADLSVFDEMADALQDHDARRREIIGFLGCAKLVRPRCARSSPGPDFGFRLARDRSVCYSPRHEVENHSMNLILR
jgi:hypothetical protein